MFAKHLSKNMFTKKQTEAPTRKGYGIGLEEIGSKNKNVIAITGDLTESTKTDIFAKKNPDRFIEAGVAEQNMMGIAAGLALDGKIPVIASYAVFNPGRNWDQLRVSVCYTNANVKIIGAHSGISVGPDGATHQALEDIAITRVLPNLTVIAPCDKEEARKAIKESIKYKGPVYIRLTRENTPIFTTNKTPFKIGKAEVYKTGKDLTIIGTGPILYEAMKAAKKLEGKISIEIINCHTIKPLDEKTIIKSAKKTKKVLTIEEHQTTGGLGSAIAEVLSEKYPVQIKKLGIPDRFGESGEPQELLDKFKLTANHIEKEIKKLIKK